MNATDRDVLRGLASRWMELASQPVMEERRRLWAALKDLHAERPMIVFETGILEEYVRDDELQCSDPVLRGIERRMLWNIRHTEEVGDDKVLEPRWYNHWDICGSGYGVEITTESAVDTENESHGYAFGHPIRTPEDLGKLVSQTWEVNRLASRDRLELLNQAFGDILPVVQGCLQDQRRPAPAASVDRYGAVTDRRRTVV